MKISGGLENIDKIEATLTITMPLSEWMELKKQLAERYPSWKLGAAISDLWSKARQEYAQRLEEEKPRG